MSGEAYDPLLLDWMSSFYDQKSFTEETRSAERKRRVELGHFVMQADIPGGGKKFRAFRNIDEAYQFLISQPQSQRNFYETVFDYHPYQKPYFDLDIVPTPEDPMDHNELLDRLLTTIKNIIDPEFDLEDDIGVYSSHASDKSKMSYHIVLTGYHVTGHSQAEDFAKAVKKRLIYGTPGPASEEAIFITKCLDLNVYKKLQQFRILGCTKLGKQRYKTIVFQYHAAGRLRERLAMKDPKEEFLRSLITAVDLTRSKILEIPREVEDPVQSRVKILMEMGVRRKCTLVDLEALWLKEPGEILSHLINAGHLTHDLASNCTHVRPKTSERGAMIELRAPPSGGYYCDICYRRHEHENPYITLHQDSSPSPASTELCPRVVGIVYHCRRDPLSTLRLCSIRGGGKSGMSSFTCLEEPYDPRCGQKDLKFDS